MKLAGIVCLACACMGMGWYFSHLLIVQQQNLMLFLQLIEHMKEEIRYHAGSVAAMVETLTAQPPYRQMSAFVQLREQTEAGKDFYQAMKEALDNCHKELAFDHEDVRQLLLFAGGIGVSDAAGQIEHCERCAAMLQARITHLQEKNTPRVKLFRSGGVIAGIFLAIVLL